MENVEGRENDIDFFCGRVKNIPCEFLDNFHVGTPCRSYKAFESLRH